jgi:hypothetical protein
MDVFLSPLISARSLNAQSNEAMSRLQRRWQYEGSEGAFELLQEPRKITEILC